MTERNQGHHPGNAQPKPQWPDPAGHAVSDPSVAAIVATLGAVPGLPVSEHEAVYGELHDALLQALNEDAPNTDGEA